MSDKNTFGGLGNLGAGLTDRDFNQIPSDDVDPGIDPIVEPTIDDTDDDVIVDPSSINTDDVDDGIDPSQVDDDTTNDDDPADDDNNDDTSIVSDLGEMESEIASYVQEKLFEKYGWSINDNDDRFDSIDKIVNFINDTVESNSKPVYASKEIENLNNYVQNGGNIESYLNSRYEGNVDIDKLDLYDSSNQTLVLREFFKEQGISSDKIESRIQRYDDTGILEDEAREAYEILKKTRKEKSEQLLTNQQKQREEALKQQQDFYNNVASTIDKMQNVMGIPMTSAEKKQLTDYIFKPLSDGKTAYQKEYESSVDNLVESAFFTMKKKALINKMNKKASSEAARALKEKLQGKTKRGNNTDRTYDLEENSGKSILSRFGSSLSTGQFN